VHTNSVLLSTVIGTYESAIAIADVKGIYLNIVINEFIILKLVNE
jgi:hypothetical protein